MNGALTAAGAEEAAALGRLEARLAVSCGSVGSALLLLAGDGLPLGGFGCMWQLYPLASLLNSFLLNS